MAEWTLVLGAEAMPEQTMKAVSAGGKRLIVYRTKSGFFATDRRCTHQAADLMRGYFDEDIIECPMHQGRFNVCTGAALSAPASLPLASYRLKLEGGRLWIEV
jgi:3-phenylpropionate/trans-cinnamate dioxygenase ferredoxin subunit